MVPGICAYWKIFGYKVLYIFTYLGIKKTNKVLVYKILLSYLSCSQICLNLIWMIAILAIHKIDRNFFGLPSARLLCFACVCLFWWCGFVSWAFGKGCAHQCRKCKCWVQGAVTTSLLLLQLPPPPFAVHKSQKFLLHKALVPLLFLLFFLLIVQ